ncbi:MAG TPA: hypothetical protein VM513_30250 [Kofleriaceae bacterium]|nr:hypothetical protein [Kofleriaceae bacterium]
MIARARLWLSYQRYGLALVGAPFAAVGGAAVLAPWWVAMLVGLVAIAPVRFGVEVLGRWPRKLRATRISLGRIKAGRFRPEHIRSYCGDPCFRVVAHEILTRAGIPRAERRRIVARFREELRRERDVLVVIDHVRGTVITFGGDAEERPTR